MKDSSDKGVSCELGSGSPRSFFAIGGAGRSELEAMIVSNILLSLLQLCKQGFTFFLMGKIPVDLNVFFSLRLARFFLNASQIIL